MKKDLSKHPGEMREAPGSAVSQGKAPEWLEEVYNFYEFAPVGYISMDVRGRIVAANLTFCSMLGTARSELLGHSMTSFVQREDRDAFYLHLRRLRIDKVPQACELRINSARGPMHYLRLESSYAENQMGRGSIRTITIDITKTKEMEEELRKSRDELEIRVRERTAELETRNKELQNFAFVASHDLTEPLRKVQTFGTLLIEKCGISLDETCRDYIRRMRNAAARMQNLLNSLLLYSRVTTKAEPFKETDLNISVEEALSNLEVMIKEMNARVEVGDMPRVKADRIQMIQLFQNLIGNALKFSQKGEAPHVKIHAKKMDGVKGTYEIYVGDNGIGFEEKYLDKIFLPFQRLHGRSSEYEGVGIGLAICRKIIDRHGGKITARSEVGKGATFIVTLPANRKAQ